MFLAILCIKDSKVFSGLIPIPMKDILNEFEDVMSQDIPKQLSPRRIVDHESECVAAAKPPLGGIQHVTTRAHRALDTVDGNARHMDYCAFQVPLWVPCAIPKETREHSETLCGLLSSKQDHHEEQTSYTINGGPIRQIGCCYSIYKIDLKTSYWLVQIVEGD